MWTQPLCLRAWKELGKLFAFRGRCTLWLGERQDAANMLAPFKMKFIPRTVHTVCTRINYKIVPVRNLHKYLEYGTTGTE